MTISILPDGLVNQIAAGEVIERPAAVVRELVENSIDAGASQIVIQVTDGGLGRISVRDNGVGMSREDLMMAVQRHATSKISTQDDLWAIHSLGFRGEALPSIGAVARLSLTSAQSDETAWMLRVDGGVALDPEPAAHPIGTTVQVRDLFYATPARLKFMKSRLAETRAISRAVMHIAYAHPSVAIRLEVDGKTRFDLVAGDLPTRVEALTNKEFWQKSQNIQIDHEAVTLRGRVATSNYHAATLQEIILMVNGRVIQDKALVGAVRGAYHDYLPRRRFPAVVLDLRVPVEAVDMNVHPAKAEVRLRDAERIRAVVVRSLREKLAVPLAAQAQRDWQQDEQQQIAGGTAAASSYRSRPLPERPQGVQRFDRDRVSVAQAAESYASFAPAGFRASNDSVPAASKSDYQEQMLSDDQPLGRAVTQLFETYILAEAPAGLILVDQHAAHERLVYEQMKQRLDGGDAVAKQGLLVPEIVDLATDEAEALLAQAEGLARLGLEIESFGGGAVAVQSVPALLGKKASVTELIRDLAAQMADAATDKDILTETLEHICATMACHGSIRAGRRLSIDEMNAMLRQIEATPHAMTCNHGRPTVMTYDRAALEKLFERR